jgi:hypothetical protein
MDDVVAAGARAKDSCQRLRMCVLVQQCPWLRPQAVSLLPMFAKVQRIGHVPDKVPQRRDSVIRQVGNRAQEVLCPSFLQGDELQTAP